MEDGKTGGCCSGDNTILVNRGSLREGQRSIGDSDGLDLISIGLEVGVKFHPGRRLSAGAGPSSGLYGIRWLLRGGMGDSFRRTSRSYAVIEALIASLRSDSSLCRLFEGLSLICIFSNSLCVSLRPSSCRLLSQPPLLLSRLSR